MTDCASLLASVNGLLRRDSDERLNGTGSLLNSVNALLRRDDTERLTGVRSLLKHPLIQDEIAKRPMRRMLLAERFNIFSALWLDRRENYHSRFLAYLLDPKSDHDQGHFFLERFLRYMNKISALPQGEIVHEGTVRVEEQQYAGTYGIIDFVIFLANHIVIAIENKIDHSEGDRQLPRYRQWLNSLGINGQKFLVFLTPNGRDPENPDDRRDARVDLCLGYFDLVKWLDECIHALPVTALRLSTVLIQYQQICKLISGEPDMTNIKDEILNLIRQPENLKAALEISKYLEMEKNAISEKFRANVIAELTTLLSANKITDWHAMVVPWGSFGIYHKDHTNDSRNYGCIIENLFNNNKGFYGWIRPRWIDPKNLTQIDTVELSREISKKGIENINGWWVGAHNLHGNLYGNWSDETIIKIDEDNRKEDYPLAKELAQKVWQMFIEYHDAIEALPSFQQAANPS